MISCASSYPGCLRCFNHRRSTERYGSLIRDVSFSGGPVASSYLFVLLTVTHDGDDVTMGVADDTREYPCIIRATDGKDVSFSTHVRTILINSSQFQSWTFSSQITSGQLDTFLNAYGALLKSSMSTLRKRDKRREKVRAEKLAARKQRLAEPVSIEGSKRGKGRRKRQRRVKAALKQEAARQRMHEKQEAKEKTV
jgi:signal recognition particle subunit SRP14